MQEIYVQNIHGLSQQMGGNRFYTPNCKLRLCANNSVLEVRWNFIVHKDTEGKNTSAEKPENNMSRVFF